MKRHANLAFFVPHLGCPHQCVFCDQRSISGQQKEPTPDEVTETCDRYLPSEGAATEIAFFGGSFTAIDRGTMTGLLEAAYPFVRDGRASGIRISTRPDAIDGETLDILGRYGVRSIELGAQSMSDRVLALNGRGHDSASVVRASGLIREAGFSLGLQMMVGMYGADDPAGEAVYTAGRLAELLPETVRIYPTVVVENTALAALYRSGRYVPVELEQAVDVTASLMSMFRERGINVIRVGLHYEDSLVKNMIAGPYHPAFGEMCESRIFRTKIEEQLNGAQSAEVRCEPRLLSQVTGQKKSNIGYFGSRGIRITVVPDSGISGITVNKLQ
ncbi:MAG: radical SAM protein [Oscillospiraceae bacterium]|nr:radical SAM protein [Oscillospiraceae bacterium]